MTDVKKTGRCAEIKGECMMHLPFLYHRNSYGFSITGQPEKSMRKIMNILIEGAEAKTAQTHTNVGRGTTSHHTLRSTDKVESSGFALDISGTVMDNSAYAGHGRTAEEVMLEAGQEDITAQHNYMAVMSNSMSDEDFAKLQKEGFHPGSTDIETVVTIVDQIKASLLKGGTQVVGYTDAIDADTLKNITGSEAYAQELKKQFAQRDIPLTEENITAVTEAFHMLSEAETMTDGSVKYMVENNLELTPENIYTAKYSAVSDGSRQGKGYYAAGEVAGYYARKPEEIDFDKLKPQMKKVIEEAGYTADEESLADARWLVEKGIPLNADTFSLLRDIRKQHFPVSYKEFVSAAACGLADGISPAKADLSRERTYVEEAADLVEKVRAVESKAVDVMVARDIPLTLRNILAVQDKIKGGFLQDTAAEYGEEGIRSRRLLEEVRLSMSVEANLRLLRSGYRIETAPLEELVSKLKEAESSYAKSLMGQVDAAEAEEKTSLYQETIETLRGIQSAPAAILIQVSETDNLREVYAYGTRSRLIYEKAGQSYEALMTAPRRDMGDSIQKAFRNVDDILTDMGLETTDENRKAVRILGYNSLEITEDNLTQVKEKDDLLCGVIREMKPGRVLNMIREGVNPLNMPLEELEQYLRAQEDIAGEMESYSRFLYKLENQKDITEEERSAYIGVYRLVRQIEKADDAVVGAIWESGAGFTLGNLLSSIRSSKHGRMDYSVDDTFGGVEVRDTGSLSITSQIEKAFRSDPMPDKQELYQLLEEAGDEKAGAEFDHMLYEQVRSAVKSEEAVLKHLSDYEQPVTAENLLSAGSFLKTPGHIWKEVEKLKEKKDDFLKEAGEEVLEALDGRDETGKAYEGLKETIQNLLKDMAFSDMRAALDVKAMSTLYKQMSFMGSMAREENYEIPVSIGGSLTSINLKLIHNSQKESKVTVAFEAAELGKTAAEFKFTDEKLSGFCICSSEEGSQMLKENKELLEGKLTKEQIQPGEIYFAKSEKLDLAEFSLRETEGRQSGDNSKALYRVARAFIGYVQETVIKKGNTAYENQF